MNTRRMTGMGMAVAWSVVGAVSSAWAQGSLTPPGAPNPGMRTLMQVEPRVPIRTAPYTITESGSYYLTTNLVSTGDGITIQADDVTLDLMGFTISGDRGSGDIGIWVAGATNALLRNIVVRGGTVRDFQYGLHFDCAQNSRIESLTVCSNTAYGIYLDGSHGACSGNTVRDCIISANSVDGVRLVGQSGICNGNTVAHCAIQGNASEGILLDGFGGACNGNTLSGCAISGNGSNGLYLDGEQAGACDGNIIVDCIVSDNGGDAVYLYGYAGQCNGNTVSHCASSGNEGHGILLNGSTGQCNGNTVADCAVNANGFYGVYLWAVAPGSCVGNAVTHCVVYGNRERGIFADSASGNRIENNQVTATTGTTSYGIRTTNTTANLIVQNLCYGQTANYVVNTNDSCGPIVTNSGVFATTNGAAALSPWANFSR